MKLKSMSMHQWVVAIGNRDSIIVTFVFDEGEEFVATFRQGDSLTEVALTLSMLLSRILRKVQ